MSGLAILDLTISSTSSGFVDGHFPDGNDGTGAIPLVWATTIPNFVQKQEPTSFSVDLFANYLTQPGDNTATATLTPGSALGSGWTLSSAGVLAFSGSGQSSGTIRVRATRGSFSVDSPPFNFESIAHISGGDTNPPTIPTGLTVTSKTTTSITVSVDAPSDVPTTAIPSSGMKEVRWFKGGVLDGSVSSTTTGLALKLARADYGGTTQRYFAGHWVAVSEGNMNTPLPNAGYVGIPNSGSTSATGPFSTGMTAVVVRYEWKELNSAAGVYDLVTRFENELNQCAARGVGLVAMIIVRTFQTNTLKTFTASVRSANSGTLTSSIANGTYGAAFDNGETREVTVTSGTHVAWTGNITVGSGSVTGIQLNSIANCPLPAFLRQYSEVYTSGGGGWQGWRWDPNLISSFDTLMSKFAAYDGNPHFVGIATQETSNGGISAVNGNGYTQNGYGTGLMAESDSIFKWIPTARHVFYFNFMSGNTTTGKAVLQSVVDHIAGNGAYVGSPDLVMLSGSGIYTRVYPLFETYSGPIFCSVQSGEWTGTTSVADLRPMRDLFDYGQNLIPNANGGFPFATKQLNTIVWDWHTTANANGEKYNPTLSNASTGIFNDASAVYATYTPPTSLTAGTLTQNADSYDYNLLSYGTGIGSTADNWSAGSVSINNDCTIIAKLNSISGADTSAAVAGVSFRETQNPDARVVHIVVTPTQIRARYRPTPGAAMSDILNVAGQNWTTPKWLKIKRVKSTNTFTCYYASDDHTWVNMGSIVLTMLPNVYAELFASCVGKATSITAHFQQVNIQNLASPTHTFSGLTTATSYDLSAVGRDLSLNDSAACSTVAVVTN